MRKSKLLHPAPLGIRHHSFQSLFRRPRPHLSIPFVQETQKLQEQQPTRITPSLDNHARFLATLLRRPRENSAA